MSTARTPCNDSPICSNAIKTSTMMALTCPHEVYPCGAKSPEIALKLGISLTLRINNYFDQGDSCYYHVYAADKISRS
jgi:hypothetical protein